MSNGLALHQFGAGSFSERMMGFEQMAKRKTKKRTLTKQEIEKYRKLLLEKRAEILGNVETMEDEAFGKERSELSSMPFHMADMGSDNFEQDFALGLMDGERKLLIEIEGALGRIEEGAYGICQGRGEQIPKARLNAIPWARYCLKCAELKEKGMLEAEEQEEIEAQEEQEAADESQQ